MRKADYLMNIKYLIPLLLITTGCGSSYEEMAKNEILRNASDPNLISFGRFEINNGEKDKWACIEVEVKNGDQRFVQTGTALLIHDKAKNRMLYGEAQHGMDFEKCKSFIAKMR